LKQRKEQGKACRNGTLNVVKAMDIFPHEEAPLHSTLSTLIGEITLPTTGTPTVEEAYRLCRTIVNGHYENFPVGSVITPNRLRKYVHAIYAFARGADDLADEGNVPVADRLHNLDHWQAMLDECYTGVPREPVFVALADAIRHCGLQKNDLEDLLEAFRMDVTTTGFPTYEALLGYCSKSANPIGRLVLTVFDCSTPETRALSDSLCTALQLANFWQDISIDTRRGRLYLPLEDVERFGYTSDNLQKGVVNNAFRNIVEHEVLKTEALFAASASLPVMVPYRLGVELSLTWNGGMTILRKIRRSGFDVLNHRPVVTTGDTLRILAASLFRKAT
jgi:squalene synthase HpnC